MTTRHKGCSYRFYRFFLSSFTLMGCTKGRLRTTTSPRNVVEQLFKNIVFLLLSSTALSDISLFGMFLARNALLRIVHAVFLRFSMITSNLAAVCTDIAGSHERFLDVCNNHTYHEVIKHSCKKTCGFCVTNTITVVTPTTRPFFHSVFVSPFMINSKRYLLTVSNCFLKLLEFIL